jgi:hypothetical protein
VWASGVKDLRELQLESAMSSTTLKLADRSIDGSVNSEKLKVPPLVGNIYGSVCYVG